MIATDILMDEHRVIEQVLNCLEKIVEQATVAGRLEEEPAREAIDFLRTFADRCHHGKEEAHLFPLMQTRGFGGGCGPVVVMLREHELGRLYVGGMDGAIEGASKGDADALQWFVQHGQSYIRLLREHIQKEDHCLFPSANRALKEPDQQTLMAAFEKVDAEEMGAGTREKYLALANRLADRFGISRAVNAGHHGEHQCGH
jgi:hemerythrin-like domain-containing protein